MAAVPAEKSFTLSLSKEEIRTIADALEMKRASHERMTKGKAASQAVVDAFRAEAHKTASLATKVLNLEIQS